MSTFIATPANWTNASSDANFRAWGSYISDQLTAVGLLKTADTGQIDWLTVSNPGATNTYVGYEIRVFADALQASAPIYFKIRYGEAGSTDTPGIGIQFGTGSDGAGNLTGTTSTEMKFCATSMTTGTITVAGSGANNRFSYFVSEAATNAGGLLSFERTKDSLGNDTAEGIVLVGWYGSTGNPTASTPPGMIVWSPTLGTITANSATLGALFPNGSSFIYGAQIGVAPILPEKPIFMNPILGIIGIYTADITLNTVFSAYMYGNAHTYRVPTIAWNISAFRGAGGGTECPAIRYE